MKNGLIGHWKAQQVIKSIPDSRNWDILVLRYVHGAKWKRIMADTHYASASIFRLHGKAFQAFDKMKVKVSKVLLNAGVLPFYAATCTCAGNAPVTADGR